MTIEMIEENTMKMTMETTISNGKWKWKWQWQIEFLFNDIVNCNLNLIRNRNLHRNSYGNERINVNGYVN